MRKIRLDSSPDAGSGARQLPLRVRPGSFADRAHDLIEPTFPPLVVYMMEHNGAGSLGVVINQMRSGGGAQSAAAVDRSGRVAGVRFCSSLARSNATPRFVWASSNPVCPTTRSSVRGRSTAVAHRPDADLRTVSPTGLKGCVLPGTGWGPGQPRRRTRRRSWLSRRHCRGDILRPAGRRPRFSVLRRQPWPVPLLATHPIDVPLTDGWETAFCRTLQDAVGSQSSRDRPQGIKDGWPRLGR